MGETQPHIDLLGQSFDIIHSNILALSLKRPGFCDATVLSY